MKSTCILHKRCRAGSFFATVDIGLPSKKLLSAVLPIVCIGSERIKVGGVQMTRTGTFYWVKHEGKLYK